MTTELGFLIDLLLDDECPAPIKKRVTKRIKEVEQSYTGNNGKGLAQRQEARLPPNLANTPVVAQQSPSMQRIMAQNQDLIPKPPEPVTPAAAEALKQRAALLAGAGKDKPEPGRTSPRKF